MKRKRPAVVFVETNGGINIAPQLFERVRRAGRHGNHRHHIRAVPPLGAQRRRHARDIESGSAKPIVQGLLEHAIGVDIDGMVSRGEGSKSVIAQIETSDRRWLFRAPVADAEFAIFTFVKLCSGGYQAQAPRPVHGQFVIGEIRAVAEVRIPAFARANVEHGVSGIFNHISVIAEAQGELSAARGR